MYPSTKITANSFRKDNLSNNKLTLDNLRLRQPSYDVGSHVTASTVCPVCLAACDTDSTLSYGSQTAVKPNTSRVHIAADICGSKVKQAYTFEPRLMPPKAKQTARPPPSMRPFLAHMPPGVCRDFVIAASEEMQLAGRQHEEALEAALLQAYLRYPEMFLYMTCSTDEPIDEELVHRTLMEALWLREENQRLHDMRQQEMARPPIFQTSTNETSGFGESKGKGKGKSTHENFTAFRGAGQKLGS